MLDDDDEWDKTKIEKQVMILEGNENLNILSEKEIGLVICYNKITSGKIELIDKPKLEPTYEDLLQSFNLSSTSRWCCACDISMKSITINPPISRNRN